MLTKTIIKVIGAANYFRLKARLFKAIERKITGNASVSYSQFGEDMLLNAFFIHKQKGFYVDIGAYHPMDYSNTFHFYKKGWRGINVDPTPGVMDRFRVMRPEDINIACAAGQIETELDFYVFEMRAVNSVSKAGVQYVKDTFNKEPIEVVKVKCKTLKAILDEYMPASEQGIDFLTIDVEGADYEVLASNDWDKYRPTYICVEDHRHIKDIPASPLTVFLEEKNYEWVGRVGPTNFFRLHQYD